jgi:hypothetical protein
MRWLEVKWFKSADIILFNLHVTIASVHTWHDRFTFISKKLIKSSNGKVKTGLYKKPFRVFWYKVCQYNDYLGCIKWFIKSWGNILGQFTVNWHFKAEGFHSNNVVLHGLDVFLFCVLTFKIDRMIGRYVV